LAQETLGIREEILGDMNPQTALAYQNLASRYVGLAEYLSLLAPLGAVWCPQ
jgi:hypothetical protein